jgi:wobble nucleotide-excising tRNase
MIEAISRIENIGTFHRFAPEAPVRFQKLTLIYGPNGTGKTTLCAILRSLARNDTDILKGRKTLGRDGPSRVDITLAGGKSCIWNGDTWEGERPRIDIYDEQFVRENLYTETVEVDQKRNLLQVVLGEGAVRLQEEIKKLDDDSRETQREIPRREEELTKILGDRLTLNDFLNVQKDPEIDKKNRGQGSGGRGASRCRRDKNESQTASASAPGSAERARGYTAANDRAGRSGRREKAR